MWVSVGRLGRPQLRLGVVELRRVLEARVRNMYTVLQAKKNHVHCHQDKRQVLKKFDVYAKQLKAAGFAGQVPLWNSEGTQDSHYQPGVRSPTWHL